VIRKHPFYVILYVLSAAAVALMSIMLKDPEATRHSTYSQQHPHSFVLLSHVVILTGIRRLLSELDIFPATKSPLSAEDSLFNENDMRELLQRSSIDQQMSTGQFRLEKLPLDLNTDSTFGGFNPALARNTHEVRGKSLLNTR